MRKLRAIIYLLLSDEWYMWTRTVAKAVTYSRVEASPELGAGSILEIMNWLKDIERTIKKPHDTD